MRLYLCEKPSQANDLARVVGANQKVSGYRQGNGVIVTWCIGHLLELANPEQYDPAWAKWSLESLPMIPSPWRLEPRKEALSQLKVIDQCLRLASEVVISTDAGREGEMIGRSVLERCRWRGPVWRLWVSALDADSLRKALANLLPGARTEPLYHAALARSRADWLVGINLTRAFSVASGGAGVISIGRVQTPTLRLVVERDHLIEHFVPVPYYVVVAQLQVASGRFHARWKPPEACADAEGRCTLEDVALAVQQRIAGAVGVIQDAQTRRKRESPPLPYSLSTLQQEANRRFGYTAKETLDTTQALYETHKAITYPRTDCTYLARSQQADAPNVLAVLAVNLPTLTNLITAANPALVSSAWNDERLSDHHAIIPTGTAIDLASLNARERSLYELIARRYLAQFYPAHEYDHLQVRVLLNGERFDASGKTVTTPGWKVVYAETTSPLAQGESDKDDADDNSAHAALPPLSQGDTVQGVQGDLQSKMTQPPRHFTDGDLEAAMEHVDRYIEDPRLKAVMRNKEKVGIGTIATRASIMETLIARRYLCRQGRSLVSTPLGRELIRVIPPQVADPATTALWELSLEEIAKGNGSPEAFVAHQAQWVEALVNWVREEWRQQRIQLPADTATPPPSSSSRKPSQANPRRQTATGKKSTPKTGNKRTKKTVTPNRARTTDAAAASGAAQCPQCGTGEEVMRITKNGSNAGRQFYSCTQSCGHFRWG